MTLTVPLSKVEVVRSSQGALRAYQLPEVESAISRLAEPCRRGSVRAFVDEDVLTYLINIPAEWDADVELTRGINAIIEAGRGKQSFTRMLEVATSVLAKDKPNEVRRRRWRNGYPVVELTAEQAAAFLLLQQLAASSS